ncbi:MAG: UrcA family protein [Pseudomonadota bacterium]
MNTRAKVQSVILAASLTFGAAAFAAGPGQHRTTSVNVQFYDLNLETVSGAVTLYSRLQRASRKACDLRSRRVHSLQEASDAKRCYRDALSLAVEKIDRKMLTELHRS